MKIAILSDIHGNSWALNDVLEDIKSKKIETIINLGDSLNGPLDPKGTFNLLVENNVLSISGNGDRLILESLESISKFKTMEYVKTQIDNDVIDWLRKLPFELINNNIYCCHASPDSDTSYLLENLKADHIEIKENSEIDKILKDIKQDIIVCGHSHVSRIVKTANKIILNTGSVGLHAYSDKLPIPHKMENFNSYARYSIITLSENPVKIEQVAISYDYEAAAKKAEKNERSDWAKWIRTGRA
ncbi:MAG: metallophosphoesterase family protein [archaeon]|nr:metallophosphoesterase family protein [archaeon]